MFSAGEGIKANADMAGRLYVYCAVQPMRFEGQSGNNNAIHECRRTVAATIIRDQGADQEALRRAALWLRASMSESNDVKEDSEIGVRARRSTRETLDLYDAVAKRLDKKSKQWVEKSLKNWTLIRQIIEDRTEFPLTLVDCDPNELKI